jgi:hypothetical protein
MAISLAVETQPPAFKLYLCIAALKVNDKIMDITQLKMFQTVVECGTMAKASMQLHN